MYSRVFERTIKICGKLDANTVERFAFSDVTRRLMVTIDMSIASSSVYCSKFETRLRIHLFVDTTTITQVCFLNVACFFQRQVYFYILKIKNQSHTLSIIKKHSF